MQTTGEKNKNKEKDGELERREEKQEGQKVNQTRQNEKRQNKQQRTKNRNLLLIRFPRVSWTGMPSWPGRVRDGSQRLEVRGERVDP